VTWQYPDYAHWQQTQQTPTHQHPHLTYWQTQFNPAPEPLRLPTSGKTSHPTHPTDGNAGLRTPFTLPATSYQPLKQLAQQSQVTPFTLLWAGLCALLNRTTGQTDLLLLTPVAGRTRPEWAGVVGYFNDLLVLRADVTGDPSVATLLPRLHPRLLAALEHQALPFAQVAALPEVARVPLTRLLLALDDEEKPLQLRGITAVKETLPQQTADFDLAFFIHETPAGDLHGVILSKLALFTPHASQQLAENFVGLLTAVAQNPHLPLSQLPLRHEEQAQAQTETHPAPPAHPPHTLPRNDTESQLLTIWQTLLQLDQISIHDNFFALGGHSLLALRLFEQISQTTGQNLPLATLFRAPTIAQLAELLTSDSPPQAWSSLVPIQPQGELPPLFFVHAHGGNVVGYEALGRYLAPDQPLYGLQAHGLSGDVPLLTDFAAMATHYLAEMRQVQAQGPYAIGGWCLGGYVAFEMAHQLQAQGEEVAFLGLFEAPHPAYDAPAKATAWPLRTVRRMADRWQIEWGRLQEQPAGAKGVYLRERWQRLWHNWQIKRAKKQGQGAMADSASVQAAALARIEATHEAASQAYEWRVYHGRVTIFRAAQQPRGRPTDPTLGWRDWVRGDINVETIPGTRIGMLEEPRVALSAQAIKKGMKGEG
jgi:thioesterase domain-containing protein/aryl carrier-like protein